MTIPAACAPLQKELITYQADYRDAQCDLAQATNFSEKEYYARVVKEYIQKIKSTEQSLNACIARHGQHLA
jgi:hypothetical protein